jgi:hypothetical protein
MFKSLGILIGGVFVGAVAAEVIRKKYPGALNKVYTKTREVATQAKEAFRKGYEGATRPKGAAQPSA